jgi:cytochrome c-type biogenesis protein CcmH/NrfF
MKARAIGIILSLLAFVMVTTACAATVTITNTLPPASPTSLDAATLVEERCTVCHSINRIQTARYSASDWKGVVDAMIARGAQLNPAEESLVVDWLAANYGP